MSDTGIHAAPRGRVRDSLVDYQAHYSEANKSPTRQFNNGGSTGRSEYDRTQVGSEKDAKVTRKMEIRKKTKEEEGEEPKEQGTRVATRAGVPAQELEADTGCPVPARDEQLEELNPRTMDEDHQDIAARTSSDQDQDNGVQTMAKRTEDEEDKEDKNNEDEKDQDEDTEDKAVRTLTTETAVAARARATAGATAAGATVAAASVVDTTHDAAACLTDQFSNDGNLCSVVKLTRAGAGDVRDTPGADGEGTGRAEAPCLHSSAGDVKYAAPVWQAGGPAGPHRGTQSCVPQPGVGTGSALNIPTSAHKRHTHLPAMNENPLTTGADSAAETASVVVQTAEDGIVPDGVVDATVTATLHSQMRHTQTPGAASLVTDTTAALTVRGDVSGDIVGAAADLNNPQQNHNEIPCVTASERVASATRKGVVGVVASATEHNTLSDGTPVAVQMNGWQVQQQLAAAKDASTGPMETGDESADILLECCMNAVHECCMNAPMEKGTKYAANGADEGDAREAAVLDEEVTHQLRLAGTPGGFSDLDKVDATARAMQVNLSVKTASWKKVYAAESVAAVAAMIQVDDAAEPVAAVAAMDSKLMTQQSQWQQWQQ